MNPIMAANKLPSSINNLLELTKGTKYECFEPIFTSIELMVVNIIDKSMIRNSQHNPNSNLHQISEEFRKALSLQYQNAWGFVLALFVSFFQKLDNTCVDCIKSSILSLEKFAKDPKAKYNSIATEAINTSIKVIGPQSFLEILPLQFDLPLDDKERREWILPCLTKSITGAKLEFFGTFFIPLIKTIKSDIEITESTNDAIANKHFKVLYQQVWQLLPAFCNFPVDVQDNFKNLAKIIGTLLNDEPELRIILCKALYTLINSNRSLIQRSDEFYLEDNDEEASDSFTKPIKFDKSLKLPNNIISIEEAQENLNAIGKFSKNFFPILFNIFCGMDSYSSDLKLRSSLYNAIKAFALISDKSVRIVFL